MKNFARILALLASTSLLAGCGCGDQWAKRELVLTALGRSDPIELDLSQLPKDAVEMRIEKRDGCENPITVLRVIVRQPLKVVLIPTTQP